MLVQGNSSASESSESSDEKTNKILCSALSFETIRDVAFPELEDVICRSRKVVALQTYVDRIPSSTEFEDLAAMFDGLALFIRVNITGVDNSNIKTLSEKHKWNFNGISNGQIFIFEHSTECSSTKLTDDAAELKSKMEKYIIDAIEIRKTRRKALLETEKDPNHCALHKKK